MKKIQYAQFIVGEVKVSAQKLGKFDSSATPISFSVPASWTFDALASQVGVIASSTPVQ